MKQIYYIGVDISKEKVDVALMDQNYRVLLEKVVQNEDGKLSSFFKTVLKKFNIEKEQLLICCEETGIYKRPLQRICVEMKLNLWVEQALKIKRASSSLRGKSDKQDAIRIADYACRYSDKQFLYKEASKAITTLKILLNARDTVIDQITRFKQQLNESKRFDKEKYNIQRTCFQASLNALKKQLLGIENQLEETLKECSEMKKNLQLLTSIPGIGRQTALNFIVYTDNFTLFKSFKQLSCYAGIAPFPNESGTLIKKARVSHLANKKLKKLLHMASMACIKAKGELKEYYIRKVIEGKNKMLVLNNLRNKLVKRMYAVINRSSEYVSIKNETNICFLS